MIKAVAAEGVFVVKQHVKKRRQLGEAGIGENRQLNGTALLIDKEVGNALRAAEQNVSAPAIAAPAVASGIVAVMSIRPGNAPVELSLNLVLSRTWSRV